MRQTLDIILGEIANSLHRAQSLAKDADSRETLEGCRIAILLVRASECQVQKPKNQPAGHHGG